MLEVKNLKLFENSDELLNFVVKSGDGLQINSSSGGGKTKLFKILTGLLIPIEGEVFYDNDNLYLNDFFQLAMARKKIGAIFEYPSILSNLTMKGNIEFVLNSKNLTWNKAIDDLVLEFNLENCLQLRPVNLSKRQVLNFNFLKVMISHPKFVFIDDIKLDNQNKSERYFIEYLEKNKESLTLVYMGNVGSNLKHLFNNFIAIETSVKKVAEISHAA